ncbi:MAG: hydantoinase B/oxoprolinase family protein [Burkholderiaceae bacterium]
MAFTQWKRCPDSGGDGEHRGGLGAIYESKLLNRRQRVRLWRSAASSPQGVAGGGRTATNEISYCQQGQWSTPPMVSSRSAYAWYGATGSHRHPGWWRMQPAGGRSRQARERDLALGLVTQARRGGGAIDSRASPAASISAAPSPMCLRSTRRPGPSTSPRCPRPRPIRRAVS